MRWSLSTWLRAFYPTERALNRKPRRRRLQLEELERRDAPSISASGPEFRVNTFTTGTQQLYSASPGSVAVDAAGDFVVAWSSLNQDGSGLGVYAQRYNAKGVAQGAE